jgi:hypothetical protein
MNAIEMLVQHHRHMEGAQEMMRRGEERRPPTADVEGE